MYLVLAKQDSYAANEPRDTASTICQLCNGLHWTSSNYIKGNRYAFNLHLFVHFILITVPLKTKTADEVLMAYIKEILPKTSCSKFILQDNGT